MHICLCCGLGWEHDVCGAKNGNSVDTLVGATEACERGSFEIVMAHPKIKGTYLITVSLS